MPAQPGRRQATQYKLLVFTATSQVFFKSDSLHPYCKNACEANTMCGEVRVPEEHLRYSTVCTNECVVCIVQYSLKLQVQRKYAGAFGYIKRNFQLCL